jgi:hypothetical protein
MNARQLLFICLAGWLNRQKQLGIEHLQEEVKILREQLDKKPRFTDDGSNARTGASPAASSGLRCLARPSEAHFSIGSKRAKARPSAHELIGSIESAGHGGPAPGFDAARPHSRGPKVLAISRRYRSDPPGNQAI